MNSTIINYFPHHFYFFVLLTLATEINSEREKLILFIPQFLSPNLPNAQ